jgi:hypothetical protein
MYKLDCSYYTKEFKHLDELVNDCIQSGMDPNYDVLFNGVNCGVLIDFISF